MTPARARESILNHFKVSHLSSLGFIENQENYLPLGILLIYLSQNMGSLKHLKHLEIYTGEYNLLMDEATIRNLELVRNLREGDSQFSFIKVLDNTKTGMGARLLRKWILMPSRNLGEINKRQQALSLFFSRPHIMREVQGILGSCRDLERLAVRLSLDKAHARDLSYIALTLEKVIALQDIFSREDLKEISFLSSQKIGEAKGIYDSILETLHPEPATNFSVGHLILDGFSEDLDKLRDLEASGKNSLQEYLQEEKKKTGINSLKIKYNKMIGYHFEIPKSQSALAPDYFIKRQTFLTGDRFVTPELSQIEQLVTTAGDRALALEKELFFLFRESLKESSSLLLEIAEFIGLWDIYTNLAYIALEQDFTRPTLQETGTGISIEKGRHPVVEYYGKSHSFIANDLSLKKEASYFSFLTGPNMAGKSTYLRQVALIVLLAQMGSYVPASSATLGLVDKIFCRVGASDNLARGESTFLVEMNETSYILRNATPHSLVILDEVGRGTSTFDGLAIAWAVSEYLLEESKSFALFATHYHELAQFNDPRIQHLSLAVKVRGDDITFLRRIEKKPSLSSYGIPVAKLAGLPARVIARAKDLLSHLEKGNLSLSSLPSQRFKEEESQSAQGESLLRELREIDINHLTPLQALSLLSKWKGQWEL